MDPVAAGVPDYYNVIPKEDCRDLTTIQRNLAQDRYTSIESVEADVLLMIDNCLTFNHSTSFVYISGEETKALFETAFAKVKGDSSKASGGTKRASKESGGVPSKKQRY